MSLFRLGVFGDIFGDVLFVCWVVVVRCLELIGFLILILWLLELGWMFVIFLGGRLLYNVIWGWFVRCLFILRLWCWCVFRLFDLLLRRFCIRCWVEEKDFFGKIVRWLLMVKLWGLNFVDCWFDVLRSWVCVGFIFYWFMMLVLWWWWCFVKVKLCFFILFLLLWLNEY